MLLRNGNNKIKGESKKVEEIRFVTASEGAEIVLGIRKKKMDEKLAKQYEVCTNAIKAAIENAKSSGYVGNMYSEVSGLTDKGLLKPIKIQLEKAGWVLVNGRNPGTSIVKPTEELAKKFFAQNEELMANY